MAGRVVIVDCGNGNLPSVWRCLERIGSDCCVSSKAADIASCDKLILAGIGHFDSAMAELRRAALIDPLEKAALVDKKPVLGICLGMELMAKTSEEGTAQGLGWLDATVVRFKMPEKLNYKVPHIGWNRIMSKKRPSPLTEKIPDSAEFYFLHSYYLSVADGADVVNETSYGTLFPSAIQKDNIFGVQFHPEKSHVAGQQLLKNFTEL